MDRQVYLSLIFFVRGIVIPFGLTVYPARQVYRSRLLCAEYYCRTVYTVDRHFFLSLKQGVGLTEGHLPYHLTNNILPL